MTKAINDLSKRTQQYHWLLNEVLAGIPLRQIAEALGVSPATILRQRERVRIRPSPRMARLMQRAIKLMQDLCSEKGLELSRWRELKLSQEEVQTWPFEQISSPEHRRPPSAAADKLAASRDFESRLKAMFGDTSEDEYMDFVLVTLAIAGKMSHEELQKWLYPNNSSPNYRPPPSARASWGSMVGNLDLVFKAFLDGDWSTEEERAKLHKVIRDSSIAWQLDMVLAVLWKVIDKSRSVKKAEFVKRVTDVAFHLQDVRDGLPDGYLFKKREEESRCLLKEIDEELAYHDKLMLKRKEVLGGKQQS